MATIRTAIALYDGVTGPLRSIQRAMNATMSAFESLDQASGNAIDTASLRQAQAELNDVFADFERTRDSISRSEQAQDSLNRSIREGTTAADGLLRKITSMAAAYMSLSSIKNLVTDSLKSADIQLDAQVQLHTTLANSGDLDAYETLLDKASEIQGRGIYGDEAMIGAAAEFSTYLSNGDAVMSMMDTLSNYAMGMSGGGELSPEQIVDYATQLGKVLNGTFDGIAKKGFTVSDAQKKILENGTEMEKVAVVADIINESWSGLYETMSRTPRGQLIQFNNTLGDIKETVGAGVYPAVLNFMQVFQQNLPRIQQAADNFAASVSAILTLLTYLAEGALDVGAAISDNWSLIQPVIAGIAAALLLYNGYLLANNLLTAISNAQKGLAAVQAYRAAAANTALAASEQAEAMAAASATAAQFGFNAALLACPVTWVVAIIIALVTALYLGVAAFNKLTGSAVSATGIICGVVATAVALILNLGIGLYNSFLALIGGFVDFFLGIIEWVLNAANGGFDSFGDAVANLIGQIIGWFLSLGQVVTTIIDAIFGTDWTSGLESLKNTVTQWGKSDTSITLDRGDHSGIQRIEYGSVFDAGYSFGQGLDDKIGGLFDGSTLDSLGAFDLGNTLDQIGQNTGFTAANTAESAKKLDITSEELKYLRDIAEREAINRFTTAEIHIDQTNHNNIAGGMDVDGIMDSWTEWFAEKLDISYEGVHP